MDYQHKFKFRVNRQRISSDGKAAIYLIVSINGERSKPMPMDLRWYPERINPMTGECSANSKSKAVKKEAADISLSLGQELSKARSVVLQARLEQRKLTLASFLEDFNDFHIRTDFVAFARKEIEWRSVHDKRSFSTNTQKAHTSSIDKLSGYALYKGMDGVKFSSFDSQWCYEYETYLVEHENMQAGSVWRHMKDIRTYMNRAKKKHAIPFYYPFQDYNLVRPEPDPNRQEDEILSNDEESLLWQYYQACKPKGTHRRVLQAAFASLDVGFRISDLERIEKRQVDFIVKRVSYTPWKQRRPTKKRPIPPILNNMITDRALICMRDSIRENNPKIGQKPEECVFDLMSEQKSRRILKYIMRKLGIAKHVTWHTLRHTCATKMSDAGMNEFQLMDYFGWANISTARRYVKKRTATLDEIVSRLNTKKAVTL